ncbi:LlaJI family restriction endonuclease [Polycladidibacter hongkongensis]|uniref:LlaJI family restriction endonuclease n=1 Tax=Polycladidibacter hongkongensis TaxID=1647556 RepID=UPI00083059DC|nr:LlaJI family restriction endonuclease [Pseudovibrio hongkongensis]
MELLLFNDRCVVEVLESASPESLALLRRLGKGKTERKNSIHFCGMIHGDNGKASFFLPRQTGQTIENASLVLDCLAKYGREVTSRTGNWHADSGNAGLLYIIKALAEDFLAYGIYADRVRVASRDSGKPAWRETVRKEIPLLSQGGNVVYPAFRTTRTTDARNFPLSRVQAVVMCEIAEKFGWWLCGLSAHKAVLKSYDRPTEQRALWAKMLRSLLPTLFENRVINLVNLLVAYLEADSGVTEGGLVLGLEDFHTVWEHMLGKTLVGATEGWNSRLPRAAFRKREGGMDVQERGMQTDIVLETTDNASGERSLTIVDAKYYDATGTKSVPGWGDVVKQLFYERALKTVVPAADVSNCFVFPCRPNEGRKYTAVEMQDRAGNRLPTLGSFDCYYLGIENVMKSYVAGRQDLTLTD